MVAQHWGHLKRSPCNRRVISKTIGVLHTGHGSDCGLVIIYIVFSSILPDMGCMLLVYISISSNTPLGKEMELAFIFTLRAEAFLLSPDYTDFAILPFNATSHSPPK